MRKALSLVFVLLALGLVACGDDSNAQNTPSVPGQAATPAPQNPDGAGAVSTQVPNIPAGNESATGSGVFRRLWADPPTLDPHLTGDTTSAFIVVEVFSGLVTLNTDLQIEPDIAERWTIGNNGTLYTFKLRDNVKFHNGKRVTAADFKWSIERAANPRTASTVAETYLNDIVGAEDYFDGKTTDIAGVRVIDDLTLQIEVDAPKTYFLAKLTYPTAFVLDREVVEAGGRNWWVKTPVGTGPFKITEYRLGERIVLGRNSDFYKTPANIQSIHMNLAGGQSMAMYENNEIHVTGVGLFDLERVLDTKNPLNKELVVAPPGFDISYIGFNTTMPPFDDPKFRQALNHAVDKELIATEVLSELVTPAYNILPPGMPGYSPDIKGLKHDESLAKKLLSESKYPDASNRPRIVISVPGTGGTIGLDLEVIIEMWKQVLGVQVEIQQVEWATFLEDLDDHKFQAYAGLGWSADYPDPQDFLDILFHSDSALNHGQYSNAEADRLLEQARTEQDPVRRVQLYNQAEQILISDAAWVPLWFTGEQYALVKPYIQNYRLTPMIVPRLRQIVIKK